MEFVSHKNREDRDGTGIALAPVGSDFFTRRR